MYQSAEPHHIPGIKALWKEVFHEEPVLPDAPAYVAEENGQVIAMLFALPQIFRAECDYKAAYFYAVATHPEYRGRGICRNLMKFAESRVDARCVVLTPAQPSLFGFYEKLGYEAAFTRNRTPFPGGRPISMAEYLQKREAMLQLPHMVYDTLSYAQRLYGLTFYETTAGIAAAGEAYTAEVLPQDLGGNACAMIKWLGDKVTAAPGFLGFSLE